MTDVSVTAAFVCLAASVLCARFLPRRSFALRMVPVLPIFAAIFFAFSSIEAPVPAWLNAAIGIVALLAIGVDGALRFKGSDQRARAGE